MASLVVNTSTINVTDVNQNTITVNFTSDKTLTDVKLSTDNGNTYKDKISMTQTGAVFNISSMGNNTYNCKLKGYYEEADSSEPPSSGGGSSSSISVNSSYSIKANEMLEISYITSANIPSSCAWELRQNGTYLCSAYKDSSSAKVVCYTGNLSTGTHNNITLVAKEYQGSGYVDIATSNVFSITVSNSSSGGSGSGGGTGGGSTNSDISNASETAITQQYSSSHEATPNNPNPPSGAYNWINAPRINPDGSFPQSTWNAIGHWMTTYKVSGSSYYDNVGLLLQNPKAWIWNTSTKSWDVLSEDFEWGSWYREDFWDDGSGNIAGTTTWETGVSGNHSKWVKIKQTSETSGRCFHPWGYQKNWRSNSNWANGGQPYIVTKIDFKLVKYNESGVDNLDKAKLVVNSGADWWRNVGDVWQPDWSTNRDMAVGKYILATRELKRAWCTNLPQNWQYGLPE